MGAKFRIFTQEFDRKIPLKLLDTASLNSNQAYKRCKAVKHYKKGFRHLRTANEADLSKPFEKFT